MKYSAKTDKGKRRKINQDFIYATDKPIGALPNLFLLADGMGGHKAGDFASKYLVEGLCSYLEKAEPAPLARLLEQGIDKLNQELLRLSSENDNLHGMGTTLICTVIENQSAVIANIGDSRAYIIHNLRIRQITRDHSFVEEMVEKGYMRRGSKDYQESKNIITRAVGIEPSVEADFFELDLEKGDYILMCSDGLSNMLDNESILSIVRDSSSIEEKTEALIDMANINGGRDNISVVLIDPFGEVSL